MKTTCYATVCMHRFNPIMVDNYASFFNCTPVGRASDSKMAPLYSYSFWLVGTGASCPPGFSWCFFFPFAPGFSKLFGAQRSPSSDSLLNLLSPRFVIHRGGYHDLFVFP